jgi:hypothetical protein
MAAVLAPPRSLGIPGYDATEPRPLAAITAREHNEDKLSR